MNVVHIFWGLGFGGIETMLVNIANAQVKSGAKGGCKLNCVSKE